MRFKPQDFDKDDFVIGILTCFIQNLNPISSDRKLETEFENDAEMMWDKWLPYQF